MVNLIYQSGKGVDAYDCIATGIDFITKPKEEIKNDWNRAIPKNPGVQSTWTCSDKNRKSTGDNLFFCQQILEYERRRLCKGS